MAGEEVESAYEGVRDVGGERAAMQAEADAEAFGETPECRICCGGEADGALVSPCRCAGFARWVHYDCQWRWMKQSGRTVCEICNGEVEGFPPLPEVPAAAAEAAGAGRGRGDGGELDMMEVGRAQWRESRRWELLEQREARERESGDMFRRLLGLMCALSMCSFLFFVMIVFMSHVLGDGMWAWIAWRVFFFGCLLTLMFRWRRSHEVHNDSERVNVDTYRVSPATHETVLGTAGPQAPPPPRGPPP